MSLHTWCRQGRLKPSSCTAFMFNSHWGRAATGKKKSCIYAHRVTSVVSDSDPVDCGLPGFSIREGVFPGKNTGIFDPYWLPYPSRTLYFLLP